MQSIMLSITHMEVHSIPLQVIIWPLAMQEHMSIIWPPWGEEGGNRKGGRVENTEAFSLRL